MADITPSPSPHVEGSTNPVTENAYPGWPEAAVPGVDGVSANDFASAGGTSNIVDTPSKPNTAMGDTIIAGS